MAESPVRGTSVGPAQVRPAVPPEVLPLVVRLGDLIAQHERREVELEALSDASSDLTRIRDVERMLHATTRRARRLLRCDVAYLSAVARDQRTGRENPGPEAARPPTEEEFVVRAWSGPLSPGFLGTSVSTGCGVGGRVAATRRPCQVEDYQAATGIAHTRYLDRRVDGEGIRTLLGVPMEVDGRLLGILFAGRRCSRRFTDDEVQRLASLAAHAAVALDNATIFAAHQAAIRDLEQAARTLRARNEELETAGEIRARLTGLLLQDADPRAILEVVAEALGAPVSLLDPADRLVAAAAGPVADADVPQTLSPPFPAALRRAIDESRRTPRPVSARRPGDGPVYVASAATQTAVLGSVLIAPRRALSDVDLRTFELSTQVIAVSLLADAAAADADRRAAAETMRQLLDPRGTPAPVIEAVARRHLIAGVEVAVSVADLDATCPAHRLTRTVDAASRLSRRLGGLSAHYDGHLVIVHPAGDEQGIERVWRELSDAATTDLTLACSAPTSSMLSLGDRYDEAAACVRLLQRLGRGGTYAATSELGIYSLLFTPDMQARLDAVVASQLGALDDYDTRHGTQLRATALAYLDERRSPAAAAARLHVHTNTVAQRLDRVDRILGPQWRSSRSLEVHTALRLASLRA